MLPSYKLIQTSRILGLLLLGGIICVGTLARAEEKPIEWAHQGSDGDLAVYYSHERVYGSDCVRWKVVNRSNSRLRIEFVKRYWFENGGTEVDKGSIYELEPGDDAWGNVFVGDIDLADCYERANHGALTKFQLDVTNLTKLDERDHRGELSLAETCQQKGRTVCGSGCMPHDATCCSDRGRYCVSGHRCDGKGGCINIAQERRQAELERQRREEERKRQEQVRRDKLREQSEQKRSQRQAAEQRREREEAQREREAQRRQREASEERAAKREERQKESTDQVTSYAAGMLQSESTDASLDASSEWHIHVNTGALLGWTPLVENQTSTDGTTASRLKSAFGFGIGGGLELWPYVRPNFGAALWGDFGGGTLSAADSSGTMYWGRAGLKTRFGFESVGLLLIPAISWMGGGVSTDFHFQGNQVTGASTFGYAMPSVGAGLYINGMLTWELSAHVARPDLDYDRFDRGADYPIVLRLDQVVLNMIRVHFEYSWDFPYAGTPQYAITNFDEEGSGSLFRMSVSKAWDWTGGY
jgi:hypothetical protein